MVRKLWSIFWALWLAVLAAVPLRAETVTDLAPFSWDSARPQVLVLDGEITRRTPPLLGLALGRFADVAVLELSSPGGDAYAAMAMVPTIRAAGLATRIGAGDKCHSACSFLYFAGVEREAMGELGVHQLASGNEASGHFIMNDVLDVFSDLGLPDMVRRRMMQTPPDQMYVFSPDELVALGLVGPASPAVAAAPDPAPDPAPPAATPDPTPAPEPAPDPAANLPATHIALDIAGEANGRVVIELYDDIAPEHAARLTRLAREGAYDDVVFHRVIDGFMAQTGDVEFGKAGGDLARAGTGGSTYPDLAAEFSDRPFEAGTVGMARAADPDSANAQFFITFGAAPFLEGQYTVVGKVVEGLDVVNAIKRGGGDNGAVAEAPDRIVRAVALADGVELSSLALSTEPTAPATLAAQPDGQAAQVRDGFDIRFDFTDPDTTTLTIGWTLQEEFAGFVTCGTGTLRPLDGGYTQCVNSFDEAADLLFEADPAGGLSLARAEDGSRAFALDTALFLATVAPSAETVAQLGDRRFTVTVEAAQIVETSGRVGADATTATLDLTLKQIVEAPESVPANFTARFF
jgi:peptidylprolyl isomerase